MAGATDLEIANERMGTARRIRKGLGVVVRRFRVLHALYRLKVALSYFRAPLKQVFVWLVESREDTNFTYDLDPANKLYLASFVSNVTRVGPEQVQIHMSELEDDQELRSHIERLNRTQRGWYGDPVARYGRRLGWYAMVRAAKPKVVVETGTDTGLGSCVLAAALRRNVAEGFPGFLYSTDIDPAAGYLLRAPYDGFGRLLIGDSIASLGRLQERIDFFIHDSNHSPTYEWKEYVAIRDKLTEHAIIVSDNAHNTTALWEFATSTERDFLFFQEKPQRHWYPGAGIGVAFSRRPS